MQAASHIFVYAPSSNAQTLFGGENASLNRNDRRIRRIPFTTRRPTMKEAKRISHLLSWLQRLDLEAIHATADIPVTVGRSGRVTTLVGKDSSNVPAQTGKTSDRTKLKPPQVDNQVSAEQVEGSKLSSEDNLGLTPLHLAAKAGDTVKVLNLLVEGADPCLKDKMGKTPYILAKDKETRNVFRRFMAQHLDKWDWHGASVPSPLTDELEAAQIAKQVDAQRLRRELQDIIPDITWSRIIMLT